MTAPASRQLEKQPVREAILLWVAVIAGLAALRILGLALAPLRALVGAAAVAAFLYAPTRALERRGQDPHDAGWRFDRLGLDLAWGLGSSAVVLPAFALGFAVFTAHLDSLPAALRGVIAPYLSAAHPLHLRVPLTLEFGGRVLGNAAVAFSEEFFYRGYLTLRFLERWSPVKAALVAALLFALGHLLEPAPWRLATFFPALWFAFVRARTGTVVGASICHLLANVSLLLLEQAAY
jgi:membrane protease YdiL (CAAX protease family)